MSSAENETGRSMVKTDNTCKRSRRESTFEYLTFTCAITELNGAKKLTILQNVSNDTELIEVTTPTLRSERFLERDLDVTDVVLIPSRTHRDVGETQDEQILHHLFPEVMINPEGFILSPVLLDSPNELPARRGIFTERLLDDYPVNTPFEDITVLFELFGDRDEHGWREGEIKETVPLLGLIFGFDRVQVGVKHLERLILIVSSRDVGGESLKVLDLLLHLWIVVGIFDVGRYPLVVILRIHLRPCISDDFDVPREETLTEEPEQSRIRLASQRGIGLVLLSPTSPPLPLFGAQTRGTQSQPDTPSSWQGHRKLRVLIFAKSQGICVAKSGWEPINDNAPMTIVLSFNSLLVVSMEGMVPDMERGLVVADIVLQGRGR